MSRKVIFYIAFFALLVLGFYGVISVVLPGYIKPTIPPIGTVAPFTFTTQDGKPFTQKDMQGKIVAVEYFFTTCKGICPRINNNMRKVYDEFKNEKDFLILSHTCDPETDSAARLKQYADSMKVDTNRWVFLTGRKDSLYAMARHSYKIDDPANNVATIEDDFLHTQFVALVNKKGDVIKIVDALKPSEIKELAADVRKLLNQ
jgi:protein SCO1